MLLLHLVTKITDVKTWTIKILFKKHLFKLFTLSFFRAMILIQIVLELPV